MTDIIDRLIVARHREARDGAVPGWPRDLFRDAEIEIRRLRAVEDAVRQVVRIARGDS
jgi:hypothetical protein